LQSIAKDEGNKTICLFRLKLIW